MSTILFLIESGEPLDMVKNHVAEVQRVKAEVAAIAKEIGVTRVSTDRLNGALLGVVFDGPPPDGWTKPDRKFGISYPKKGPWKSRLAEHQARGYADPEGAISTAFGVPTSISYTRRDGYGCCHIGPMLKACGWLYLSKDGPFAMWIPDVEAAVKERISDGYTVEEPAASFKPVIPGARRIDQEEWDLLVAQHQLDKKRRERALAEEGGAA